MTSTRDESIVVLSGALDQLGDLLARVDAEAVGLPTPCTEWTVADLVDHVIADLVTFRQMMRGEEPDWSAPTPHVESGWAELFRDGAEGLVRAWRALGEAEVPIDPDMQTAEFGVHGWDLAIAIGSPVANLDPEVAERGLGFMQANLTDDMRGPAFGAELPAPAGADAYRRLAAFAGRGV